MTLEPSTDREPEEADGDGLRKSFLGHLEDLRAMLIRSGVALAVCMLAVIPLAPRILNLAKIPLVRAGKDPEEFLRVMAVGAGLSITMRIVFWGGLIVSLPLILWFVGRFVFPGLTRRERRAALTALGAATVLFAGGVLMGYLAMLPFGLRMMFRVSDWVGAPLAFVELGDYVGFVLRFLLAFGITFELPVVVLALGALGIVTQAQLRKKRRHVIVALMAVAMVVTPTTDPYTMLLMAAPLVALYEACIWILWYRERKDRRKR
ncbi:MAG: twin-arginine translocase subunit TatC [Lentisphaerae bacterium]|nr:twin-arginine translocase subunit TatC [Lentisphaerota bacterium]